MEEDQSDRRFSSTTFLQFFQLSNPLVVSLPSLTCTVSVQLSSLILTRVNTTPLLYYLPRSPSSDRDDLTASSLSAQLRPPHRQLLHIPLGSSSAENTLVVCLFGAKSVSTSRRRSDISTFIQDNNIDIMLLTETWLRPAGDEAKIADLAPRSWSWSSPSPALQGGPAQKTGASSSS